mgnify:CR=1 FL=1
MAKRKEIKWRWEARGTMIGRQNGIIFRIYHPWDMPEREHTVSCYDTKRAGRTISTAGYRKFTWEEAVEFCQAIAAGEIDLEDLRARFDAEDMAKEREAVPPAVISGGSMTITLEQASEAVKSLTGAWDAVCTAIERAGKALARVWQAARVALEFQEAMRWASVYNRPLAYRYRQTKKKRTRKKYAKRILAWYREEVL